MALPPIDWRTASRLAYVVRVEYGWPGEEDPRVARFCGPKWATGSGLRADVEGLGSPRNYAGRGGECTVERDLGGLASRVQSMPELVLSLDLGGADDPMLAEMQTGRWSGHRLDAWVVQLDTRRRVVAASHRFAGTVDRDPDGVTNQSSKVVATQGFVGIERRMPNYVMPGDMRPGVLEQTYTVGDTSVISANPGDTGFANVAHMFHPGTYASIPGGYAGNPKWEGVAIGPVYGNAYGGDTCWRELVCYGVNERPDVGSGVAYYFFVSPQFNCYVDEVWWSDPGAGVIRGAVDPPNATTVNQVESFNNHSPLMGPVGTCCVLRTTTGMVDSFVTEPFPELHGKVAGPDAGRVYASGVLYGGAIEALGRQAGKALDHDILGQLFEVDLGLPDTFAAGALADWAASAPQGGTTPLNYRKFHTSIPATTGDTVPLVRDAVGELLALVESDMAQRLDPATNERRMVPRRRRPNPLSVALSHLPDHTITKADLQSGHRAARTAWTRLTDPDGHYANELRAKSATYQTHPLQKPGDPTDNLAPTQHDAATVITEAEQRADAGNGVVQRAHRGKHWVHQELTGQDSYHAHAHGTGKGFTDAVAFMAAGRAQPQVAVEVELGQLGFGVELLDTVRYDLAGLVVGDGHVRKAVEDLGRFGVRLTTYHADFFEEGRGGGPAGVGGHNEDVDDSHTDPN